MEERKTIAIFGGAFNPPLNSHIYLAKEVLRKIDNVTTVVFVPVNSDYNKYGLVSNKDRYNMLELACWAQESIIVSSVEIDSPRPLYTIETLEYMKKEIYPNDDICLIIGSDNLKTLSGWKAVYRLLDEFNVIVFSRNNDDIEKIINEDRLLRKHKEAFIKIDINEYKDLSSTNVRNMIKNGEDVSSFMPKEVEDYIKKNKLYI